MNIDCDKCMIVMHQKAELGKSARGQRCSRHLHISKNTNCSIPSPQFNSCWPSSYPSDSKALFYRQLKAQEPSGKVAWQNRNFVAIFVTAQLEQNKL